MDGADDRSSTTSQGLQQGDALETGGAVQSARRLIEEHYRRIADQLQGDRETLLLTTRESAGHSASVVQKTESVQNFSDLKS